MLIADACRHLILLIRSRPARCADFTFSDPHTERVSCLCIVLADGPSSIERQSCSFKFYNVYVPFHARLKIGKITILMKK